MQAFFDLCNRTFDCPVISDPNRYVLDSGWFYDTNFHLNTPGGQTADLPAHGGPAEPAGQLCAAGL